MMLDRLTDAMDDSFAELSSFAAEELEAALAEAALVEAASQHAATTFVELARSTACGVFAEAMVACGLVTELPALSSAPQSGGVPRLVVIAPSDAALRSFALKQPAVRTNAAAMRTLCLAHLAADDAAIPGCGGGGGALHSLQGTIHCVESPDGAPVHEAAAIGGARVVTAVPFAHGVLVQVEGVLPALRVAQEARAEQIWQKAVVPAPRLEAIALPTLPDVVDPAVGAVEAHVQLVHVPTGETLPAEALRGGLRQLPAATGGTGRDGGGCALCFPELVIEHKPSNAAKKRSASPREQRRQENCYALAFSLTSRTTGRVLCAIRQPTPITLRNSFHTLSEGEKAFRREWNRQRGGPGGAGGGRSAARAAAPDSGAAARASPEPPPRRCQCRCRWCRCRCECRRRTHQWLPPPRMAPLRLLPPLTRTMWNVT